MPAPYRPRTVVEEVMPSTRRPVPGEKGPHYVYERLAVERSIAALGQALPDFVLLYSMKANPFRPMLELMRGRGLGIDAASAGEVQLALDVGFAPTDIFFSCPGKTEEDLAFALGSATVVADSLGELERLDRIAGQLGRHAGIGLRINPDASLGPQQDARLAEQGKPSKFGIDEELVLARLGAMKALQHVRIEGIHVYLRSQIASAEAICQVTARCVRLARTLEQGLDSRLSWVNVGGGFASALGAGQPSLDLELLRRGMAGLPGQLPRLRFMAEAGRFLAAGAGTFWTPIVDIKDSRGVRFYVTAGGLDGMLRPALALLLARMAHGAQAWPLEPLYSSAECHAICVVRADGTPAAGETEIVTVAGPLCTALDVLAEDIRLPKAKIGDWIVVSNAGAYCATLSPAGFASRPRPREYLI